ARTPWDLYRAAGGSSGGSAAAVAAGLLPVAHGTDGGGSVRTPASVCGLVGLKPPPGLISDGPRQGEGSGLPTHGFLARTVADVAALLDATAGRMAGDASWAPPPVEPYQVAASREPGRLRIGRHRSPPLADVDLQPDGVAAYDSTTALLVGPGPSAPGHAPPFDRALVRRVARDCCRC